MAMLGTRVMAETKLQTGTMDVRVEVVTQTYVASGRPQGIHDLWAFLEHLNNPTLSRFIELTEPSVRPLYRAEAPVRLDAPIIFCRDDVVFANFEGPHFSRGDAQLPESDAPVLLLAPPFQIRGAVAFPLGADASQAMRAAVFGFFLVKRAEVFDAEGAPLGEGDQIIINGASVQMASATALRIPAIGRKPAVRRVAAIDLPDAGSDAEEKASRAA